MRRLARFAAVVVVAAVPLATPTVTASAQGTKAAAGTVKPGTYDLELAMGGGTLPGTLVLSAAGDSLTATMHVGDHDAPVRGLKRTGGHLVIDVGAEGMTVVYQLDFDGDAVKGTFTYNGDPGLVSGKRRAAKG